MKQVKQAADFIKRNTYGKIKKVKRTKFKSDELLEYTLVMLITLGVPSIAYIYGDARSGYTAMVLALLFIITLRIRYGGSK